MGLMLYGWSTCRAGIINRTLILRYLLASRGRGSCTLSLAVAFGLILAENSKCYSPPTGSCSIRLYGELPTQNAIAHPLALVV